MANSLIGIRILTERMLIRPFEVADMTPRYLDWLNDPVALRHSQQRLRKQDLESCRAYRDGVVAAGGAMLAMCLRRGDTEVHIGNLTLRPFGPANDQIDISILIGDRSQWDRGYATEAWRAICAHLFDHHAIRRITAGTNRDNTEMLALMARTGMRPFEPDSGFPSENVYMALEPDTPPASRTNQNQTSSQG